MGISDFFKKDTKDDGDAKVNASNIPMPPKNPKGKSGAAPPPPPPGIKNSNNNQNNQGGPAMPPPPPGAGKEPTPPSPGSQSQNNAKQAPPANVPKAPEGMPNIPPPPGGNKPAPQQGSLDDIDVPKPGNMGNMPPAPQPSKVMDLPEEPDDKFQFPEFEQDEIDRMGELEQNKDQVDSDSQVDWTQSPEEEKKPVVFEKAEVTMADSSYDEGSGQVESAGLETSEESVQEDDETEALDITEDIEEEPEVLEEPDEEHKDFADEEPEFDEEDDQVSLDGRTAIHTEDGKLYVNASHYEQIFNSIRDMKNGISSLEVNLHNYSSLANDQESNYDNIAMNLNEIQEQVLNIDTRLFEKKG